MKKLTFPVLIVFALSALFASLPASVWAQNNELEDAIQDADQEVINETIKQTASMLSFESFSSCEDMNTVIGDFLEENKDSFEQRYYPRYWAEDDMVVMDLAEESADGDAAVGAPMPTSATNEAKMGIGGGSDRNSSSIDVSTTNIQVDGIDEPDILKTNGDHLFYYNTKHHTLSILKSPLDRQSATIAIEDVEVVTQIAVPEDFHSMQLFLYNDKLIMMGQRWRSHNNTNYRTYVDTSARTDIIIYDISDIENPQLDRFTDLDGSYMDARLINDDLYVVSQLSVNWWDLYQYYEANDTIDVSQLLPTVRDISYKKEGDIPLTINGTQYPYGVSTVKPGCDEILYVLPTKESLQNTNIFPSFTVVRKVDVDGTKTNIESTTAFGTAQTIHMSHKSLYLVDQIYSQNRLSCPPNAACIMPWFWGGQSNTLIHKFEVNNGSLGYDASTLIPGMPLSQYSMSEDDDGDFRILTQQFQPQSATDLYILDDDLDLLGKLTGIEPGEEFKSSRYIGDKLYLVTFERTDPLFVIDLEDKRNPEIIGELKIPGFSTYLHPYSPEKNGVQYIIGLGYGTSENQRGGIVTNGVKVDLYEIDYTKQTTGGSPEVTCTDYTYSSCPEGCTQVCTSSACTSDGVCTDDCDGPNSCTTSNENNQNGEAGISVKQLHTETFGKKGSWSEAVENPRMVVWDPARKLLVMPMILQDQETGQNCTVQYNSQGAEIGRECYDSEEYFTTFAGMKGLSITATDGINEEFSYDYTEMLKKDKDAYDSRNDAIYEWQFREANFRVGYLGDVMYALNTLFGHFVVPGANTEAFVEFIQ